MLYALLIMAASACNIHFDLPNCTSTNGSAVGVADGAMSVVAVDGNGGLVKYNLVGDFDYNTQGQVSGVFTGLVPGSYQVYARSSVSCRAVMTMVVPSDTDYQVRHRLFFDTVNQSAFTANKTFRLDIEENLYAGSIVEEKGANSPVVLSWRGEANQDVFAQIIPSEIAVNLISQTDGYFEHLFAHDERKFRAKLYKWNGSTHELYWQGFIIPMLFSEPYWLKENYDVSFTFTDGLSDLKDTPFSDDSGNFPTARISVFDAILFCIHKTNVDLPIWESVNIVNALQSTGDSDSCLKQTYVDMSVYLDSDGTAKDCATVLRSLLNNFKSRLYQANGAWHIELITEKSASSVLTRKYSYDGAFLSSSNESPRIMIRRATAPSPKIVFKDRSAQKRVLQNYGTYKLTYNLGLEDENNLLDYGQFEDEDIAHGQLKGWAVTTEAMVINDSNHFGLEQLKPARGKSEHAFFAQFDGSPIVEDVPADKKVLLHSNGIGLASPIGGYLLKLRFDLYTRPLYTDPYIYFDFSLKGFSIFGIPPRLQAKEVHNDGAGRYVVKELVTELVDGEYVRVYLDQHLTWKTIELDIHMTDPIFAQLIFRVSSNRIYDLTSIPTLKAVQTIGKDTRTFNNRRRVRPNDTSLSIYSYVLEPGDESESIPDIIRPNDYDPLDGFVWKRKSAYPIPRSYDGTTHTVITEWLQSILIDNVRIEYYPQLNPPIEEVVTTEIFNSKIKQTLEDEILHGDITSEMDLNYQYISDGFLSDSTGLPYQGGWRRRSEPTASDELHHLLVKMVKGQYKDPRVLLTGSVDVRETLPSLYNSIYEVRSGRVFIPVAMVNDLRWDTSDIEKIETLKGEAIVDEGDPLLPGEPGGPDPIEPPVNVREHTDEFTTEFA